MEDGDDEGECESEGEGEGETKMQRRKQVRLVFGGQVRVRVGASVGVAHSDGSDRRFPPPPSQWPPSKPLSRAAVSTRELPSAQPDRDDARGFLMMAIVALAMAVGIGAL